MSPVVGYATLQVIPSVRGLHDVIRRELGRVGQSAGASAGESMGRSMGSALSSATQAAYRGLEQASLVAGAAAATALAKGYSRITTIQDAQSALTISLQDSTKAASLLGEVLEVVRGTPFVLDQFAAAAQRMAGMNIEAAKVPVYLRAIGEASATQGKAANEYADRLARVFGQVSAAGQLQLIDVWRISDTGVNALAILANHFDLTRKGMKDMISEGAVPAGEALDALATGILNGSDGPAGATVALAGTMEALRKNMSGAVAGISPAMARLGAAFIEPFSPRVVDGANALTDSIDLLAEKAGSLATRLSSTPFMGDFVEFTEHAPRSLDGLISDLGELGPLAGGAATAVAALGTRGLGSMLGPLGMLVPGSQLGPLGIVAAGIAGIALSSPAARDELGALAGELLPVVSEIGDNLAPVLAEVSDSLEEVMPAAIRTAGAALVALTSSGADVVESLAPIAVSLLEISTPAITGGLDTVTGLLEDHGEVVIYAAGAWLALKAQAVGATAWTAVAGGLTVVSGGLQTVAIRAMYAAQGIGQVTVGLVTLPAATNLSAISTGFANMRTAVTGLASSALLGSVAVAGIGIAAAAMWQSWNKAKSQARADLEDLKPANFDERSIRDVELYGAALNQAWGAASDAEDAQGGFRTATEGVVQVLPMYENKVLDAFASTKEAADASEKNTRALRAMREAYVGVFEELDGPLPEGMTLGMGDSWFDEMDRWVQRLDLDPMTMSIEEMADAISAARDLSASGTPAAEDLAEAFDTLGDSTASATDQLDAYKEALDSIIGTKVSFEQAQLDFADAISALSTAARDADWADEDWSTNLFGGDAASRETRRRVADLAQEATDLAVSFYEAGGGIEGATWKLAAARSAILDAGESAGISRGVMEEYLAVLGLTPDNITTVIEAQADPESLSGTDRALDWVARNRQAVIEVDFNTRGEGVVVGGGVVLNRWGGLYEFARGGVTPAHVAMGDMYKYAEPETGGEAFIPRLGDRGRSTSILSEAAAWYGLGIYDKDAMKALAAGGAWFESGLTGQPTWIPYGTRFEDGSVLTPTTSPARTLASSSAPRQVAAGGGRGSASSDGHDGCKHYHWHTRATSWPEVVADSRFDLARFGGV